MSDYEIGYGKTPKHTRFTKGRSGNPAGRPRGSKNKKKAFGGLTEVEQMVLDEVHRYYPVQEDGRTVYMSLMQIIIRSAGARAAKGSARAQEFLANLFIQTQEKQDRVQREDFETMVHLKQSHEQKLKSHLSRGLPEEDFPHLPHPDDIIIDLNNGDVSIAGPATEEQATSLAMLKEGLLETLKEIKNLEERSWNPQPKERPDKLREDCEELSHRLEKDLNRFAELGERWPRHWPVRELEEWRVGRQITQGRKVHPPSQLIRLNLAEAMKARAQN